MYLAKTLEKSIIESVADGHGYRLVLFTCGCPHQCNMCQNKETWNMANGVSYSVPEIYRYLSKKIDEGFFDGITFSGGDPLIQDNELNTLIKLIKGKYPKINIWVYTGYLYEDVKGIPVIKNIDVLVDGKFDINKQYPKKQYRGSYNQRILYLENGLIIKEE